MRQAEIGQDHSPPLGYALFASRSFLLPSAHTMAQDSRSVVGNCAVSQLSLTPPCDSGIVGRQLAIR